MRVNPLSELAFLLEGKGVHINILEKTFKKPLLYFSEMLERVSAHSKISRLDQNCPFWFLKFPMRVMKNPTLMIRW